MGSVLEPGTNTLALVHAYRNPGEMARVPSDAAKLVGSRIRKRRIDMAWSQDVLAAQSGIESSNIRSYETGRAMMNIYSLTRIAAALGVDPGELISGLRPEDFARPTADSREGQPSS